MTKLGKIDAETFDRIIAPNLGTPRPDVWLGPTAGIDFGILDIGGQAVVVSTDPVSVLPELGLARAGSLAIDIVLSDVAVSGIDPSHLTFCLTLSSEWETDDVGELCRAIDAYAAAVDVGIVAAHVGRYPGVNSSWVGGATAVGIGEFDDVVRPDGARPGDVIVLSTGPAAEIAGLFATLYGDELDLSPADLAAARERIDDIPAVGDALAAHDAGEISAMHDATEGGIAGAFVEMARGAGVRFCIDPSAVPMGAGVAAVCRAIDVDPWSVTSCGTLVITVASEDAASVVDALERRGTRAAVVGRVETGSGVVADGKPVEAPSSDPSWAAAERLSDDS